jgi:hypothetical protein
VAALNFPESEGYVRLGAKTNGTNIYALESANGGISVFQDGIFVTQLTALLPEGARQHVVARINLMRQDKCELLFIQPSSYPDFQSSASCPLSLVSSV